MDDTALQECSVPEDVLQTLLSVSNSSTLVKSLEDLIQACKTADGREDLATKNVLPTVLQLIQSLSYPSDQHLLTLSLRLLRNLCAGEEANQNSFVEQNGVAIISNVLSSANLSLEPDFGIICVGLQVLANAALAGERQQHAIWQQLFSEKFVALARVRSQKTCGPLCMIIYTCCDGTPELVAPLCGEFGITIVKEIVKTAAAVGFGEDWYKLLLSRICLEEPFFRPLFSSLQCVGGNENGEDTERGEEPFSKEQEFLLENVSEILNERLNEITVPNDFALCVYGIFKNSIRVLSYATRGRSGLPTGSIEIDVLGYSLTILRDICAQGTLRGSTENTMDVVDILLSSGLIELLLCLLRELEPDIVGVIGNCLYGRKLVQDKIRRKDGLLLLLQQCVTDDDNPYLREWGIWCVRNLLERNQENQQAVAELELQGSVDVPDLARLGLRVEMNPETGRPKLVNIS
ncbi:putative Ataxin-10 domain-containing protein [Rosa chinensis]|uniref:Putative Ataxin-10 domain-containing protein n=1 Tax=Rosa chinensis TaxID=74649 RepID=A0A2P6S6Y8_ROSCH|nr:putative Ataxin-10 domain-containing protein [Rosa chinensis]